MRMTGLELRRSWLLWFVVILTALFVVLLIFVPLPTEQSVRDFVGGPGVHIGDDDIPDTDLEQLRRLWVTSALSFVRFFAVIFALVIGSGLIATEVSRGTVLALAVRPVNRTVIVLSKYLAAWLYLSGLMLVWGLLTGGIWFVRSGEAGMFVDALLYSLVSCLVIALFLALATTMSVLVARVLAILLPFMLWVGARIAGGVILFYSDPEGLPDILRKFDWVVDAARAYGYAVPKGTLEQWASDVTGTLPGADVSLQTATATTGHVTAAIAVTVGWVVLACVLFARRRNLT
jgi:ABC-type transport system involved in multi-copper enzyme maturation permease subunit